MSFCIDALSPNPFFLGGEWGAGGGSGRLCTGYWSPSLRTTDAFPVVAFFLQKVAIFRMERSDDRKCVCCSQVTGARTLGTFNFMFSLLKSLLLGRCSGGTILGSPSHLSSLSPFPSGEPAHGLPSKLFETFNWILMRSGENCFDKKTAKLS